MVKSLLLIRHAESAQAQAGTKDIERSLTAKGFSDASRVGRYLAENEQLPDAVLSSTAQRAKYTCELICEQFKFSLDKIDYREEMYNASVRNLLQIINELEESCRLAVLIGHNPAISYLAEYLSGEEIGNMEPCAVVKLQFESGQWQMAGQQTASLVYHLSPEQITFNNQA
ncbi:MAG: SixA phosphatase family protein [Cyclobacteriaceae bacterium]